MLTYEMRIWSPYPHATARAEGAAVFGDQGYIVIGNGRWRAYGRKGEVIAKEEGGSYDDDEPRRRTSSTACAAASKPAADLETVGHPSSLLCHLGNVAWRAGRTLQFDSRTYTFIGDDEANQYLTRPEYRKPWVLPKIEEL